MIATFITLAFVFLVLTIPLKLMGPKSKKHEDKLGNSGWRTVKTKKIRNKR